MEIAASASATVLLFPCDSSFLYSVIVPAVFGAVVATRPLGLPSASGSRFVFVGIGVGLSSSSSPPFEHAGSPASMKAAAVSSAIFDSFFFSIFSS